MQYLDDTSWDPFQNPSWSWDDTMKCPQLLFLIYENTDAGSLLLRSWGLFARETRVYDAWWPYTVRKQNINVVYYEQQGKPESYIFNSSEFGRFRHWRAQNIIAIHYNTTDSCSSVENLTTCFFLSFLNQYWWHKKKIIHSLPLFLKKTMNAAFIQIITFISQCISFSIKATELHNFHYLICWVRIG